MKDKGATIVSMLLLIPLLFIMKQAYPNAVYLGGNGPVHMQNYKDYSITSKDGKKTITGAELERNMMCRSDSSAAMYSYMVVRSFDVLDSGQLDSSSGYVSLRGMQGGKPVEVKMMFNHHPVAMMFIFVDDEMVAACG